MAKGGGGGMVPEKIIKNMAVSNIMKKKEKGKGKRERKKKKRKRGE